MYSSSENVPGAATSPVLRSVGFQRLLVLGVVLVNVVMLAFGVQSLLVSRDQSMEQVRATTANLAALLEKNISSSARSIDLSLLNIADVLEHRYREGRLSNTEIDMLLAKQLLRLPEADAFRVSDSHGRVLWGKGVDRNAPASYADRDFFIEHQANPGNQLIIAGPLVGRVSKIPVMAFTRSFRNQDGSLGGIVSAAVPVSEFTNLLSRLELGQHGSAVIRHSDRSLITRYPSVDGPGGITGDKNSSPEFAQAVASGKVSGSFHTLLAPDGIERSYAFRRIANFPALALVGLAPQDYLDNWYREVRKTALMLGVFFAASLLVAWMIRRYWLQHLVDTANLLASESRFRSYVETSPEAIFVADQAGHYLDVNHAACAMVGYSREELLHMSIGDLSLSSDLAEHLDLYERVKREKTAEVEIVVRHRDGREIDIDLHCAVLSNNRVMGVCRNITEQKQTAAELERYRTHLEQLVENRTRELAVAKDDAENASRAKSTFLANMSHELRTPMNAIMGMTGIILRKQSDPKLVSQLTKIDQASRHLLAVINDILDISKIEADRLTLEQVSFNLGEVLENLMSLMNHKALEKRLAMHVDLMPQISRLALKGDPLRLGQILLNLAGNATKFTEQGSITIRGSLIEETPLEILIRFEVQDSGIGISVADQARLFTAFEQADSSTTRKYGGTGLGLAISKRLVHLMGGEIGVESTFGQGSTFWFTARFGKMQGMKASVPMIADTSVEARLRTQYAGTRILLAEDEPINQEVSLGLLGDIGFQIDLAEDGTEAVALAKQNGYDLILMDMQMPRMNGIAATQAIRALPGHARTPILAMTANAFDEDRRICLDAGMNDHIPKPVDPDLLFEVILKWLEQARAQIAD